MGVFGVMGPADGGARQECEVGTWAISIDASIDGILLGGILLGGIEELLVDMGPADGRSGQEYKGWSFSDSPLMLLSICLVN